MTMGTTTAVGGKGKLHGDQASGFKVAPDQGQPGYPTLLTIISGNYGACASEGKPVTYEWYETEPTNAMNVKCA